MTPVAQQKDAIKNSKKSATQKHVYCNVCGLNGENGAVVLLTVPLVSFHKLFYGHEITYKLRYPDKTTYF